MYSNILNVFTTFDSKTDFVCLFFCEVILYIIAAIHPIARDISNLHVRNAKFTLYHIITHNAQLVC